MSEPTSSNITSNSKKAMVGLRTFAQDMERTRSHDKPTPPVSTKEMPSTKAPPKPTVVISESDAKENHTYQAPKWQKAPVIEEMPTVLPTPETTTKKTTTALESRPQKTRAEDIIVADNEDAASATIITDTKRKRFRLLPAITASITSWLARFKKDQAAKKIPKYVVADTNLRKGVIQKATSKTGKVTSLDTDSIQDRIRQREEKTTPKKATTTWTANTEPGYALLEDGKDYDGITSEKLQPENTEVPPSELTETDLKETPGQISNVQVFSRLSQYSKPELPEIKSSRSATVPTKETVQVKSKEQGTTEAVLSIILAPETPAPNDSLEATPVAIPPMKPAEQIEPETTPSAALLTVAETIPTPTYYSPKETTTAVPMSSTEQTTDTVRSNAILKKDTPFNLRTWLLEQSTNKISLVMVVIIVVVSVIAFAIFVILNNQITTGGTRIVYTTSLDTPLQLITPTTINKDDLANLLLSNIRENTLPVLQIGLTATDGSSLISALRLMSIFAPTLEVAFAQSINQIYFGGLQNTRAFMVIESIDPLVSRAGMLRWETTLYADLTPIIGPRIPSSRAFVDQTVSGLDTRVLFDDNSSEILAYTITPEATVIIAGSRADLEELLRLIIN